MKLKYYHLFEFFNFGTDLSLSFFSVSILAGQFDRQLNVTLIILSTFFVLLPDIDVIVEYPLRMMGKAKPYSYHQVYTHFPLIYVPVAIALMFLDEFLGTLLLVNITLHFLHDSVGTGWGIAWLWPFNKNYYKFFSDEKGSFSSNLIQVWNPKDRSKMWAAYGDRNWIENLYINSWTLKNISYEENSGPSLERLTNNYRKLRWFYYAEIIITVSGFIYLIYLLNYI